MFFLVKMYFLKMVKKSKFLFISVFYVAFTPVSSFAPREYSFNHMNIFSQLLHKKRPHGRSFFVFLIQEMLFIAADKLEKELPKPDAGQALTADDHCQDQPIDLLAAVDVHQDRRHNDGGHHDGGDRGKKTRDAVFAEIAADQPGKRGGDQRAKRAENRIPQAAQQKIANKVADKQPGNSGGRKEGEDHHCLANTELKDALRKQRARIG